MHQVDPAGDGLHPVYDPGQVVPAREGVAGVQAEADLAARPLLGPGFAAAVPLAAVPLATEIADDSPEPRDRIEAAGHCVVAASRVLDKQRDRRSIRSMALRQLP